MSVMSETDSAISRAKTSIIEAVGELVEVVTGVHYGYDEYNKPYQTTIKDSLLELLDIRDKLI